MREAVLLMALALAGGTTSCTLVGSLDEFQGGATSDQTLCTRPAAGDYAYRGEGPMTVGLGSDVLEPQQIGPTLTAAVTHDVELQPQSDRGSHEFAAASEDCCWGFAVAINADRTDRFTYCEPEPGHLEIANEGQVHGWETMTAVGYVNSATFLDCADSDITRVDMTVGASWAHQCNGETSSVEGPYFISTTWTYDGEVGLDADGEQVDAGDASAVFTAHRFGEERLIDGAADGERLSTWWFAVDDYRPLKTTGTVQLVTNTAFGSVEYEEAGNWYATP